MSPYKILCFDEIDSTNEEALRLTKQGITEPTALIAQTQTGGRGRFGNPWFSPPGNLYMSVLLPTAVPATLVAQLSFISAVAITETLEALGASRIQLKWPNDILMSDAKLGGILIEAIDDAVIIGLGVNIATKPTNLAYPATCLGDHGIISTPEDIANCFLTKFDFWYDTWCQSGFNLIREAWLRYAWRLGQRIEIKTGNDMVQGIFNGLDEAGLLMLRQEDTIKHISSGSLSYEAAPCC